MKNDHLVQYLRKRSRRHFAALVRATRQQVLDAAYRVVGDPQLAEDVTQEVFLKLLAVKWKPDEVRSGRGLLVSTTVLLARSRLRSEARRRRREVAAFTERATGGPPPVKREELWDVREAVEALPEPVRSCVELRYFGGLSTSEVSRALDIPARTVNARLERARAVLRRRLSPSAAGAMLPLLGGTGVVKFPALEISPRLAENLDRLASVGVSHARLASGASRTALRTALFATATISFVVGVGIAIHEIARDSAGHETPRTARPARADTPPPRMPPATGDSRVASAPAPVAGEGVDAKDGGAPPDAADDGGGGPTRAVFRVEDERGQLVRRGELHFRLPLDSFLVIGELPREVAEDLLPYRNLIRRPVDLAAGNPFVLEDIPDEIASLAFTCQATAPGYSPSEALEVRLERHGTTEVILELLPARTVAVSVECAADRAPVPGARVISVTERARRRLEAIEERSEGGPGVAVTDDQGRCILEGLGPGEHELEVHADGFEVHGLRLAGDEHSVLAQLTRREEEADLDVMVFDDAGRPLSGIEVELSVHGHGVSRRASSGAEGRAGFPGLPTGVEIAIRLDGSQWWKVLRETLRSDETARHRLRYEARLELENGERREVRLGFIRGIARLTAHIVGIHGQPAPGVEVRLHGSPEAGHGIIEGVSDETGTALFESIPADVYTPYVGGWRYPRLHVDDARPVVARWTIGEATVRGRVVTHEGGEPLSGISVHAEQEGIGMVSTDGDGRFRLTGLIPGACRLSTFSTDYLGERRTIEIPPSGDLEIELGMREGHRIRVEYENRTGVAVGEIDVRFQGKGGRLATMLLVDDSPDRPIWKTVAIPPGLYTVVFQLPGAAPLRRVVRLGEEPGVTELTVEF